MKKESFFIPTGRSGLALLLDELTTMKCYKHSMGKPLQKR